MTHLEQRVRTLEVSSPVIIIKLSEWLKTYREYIGMGGREEQGNGLGMKVRSQGRKKDLFFTV